MRPQSLLVLLTTALFTLASSSPSDAVIKQVSCNGSDVWSDWPDWQPDCCSEGTCSSTVSCTTGEEECTSSRITLSLTSTEIFTTTTTPEVRTTETVWSSWGTSSLVSIGSLQSSTHGTITPSSTGTHPTTFCSGGTCIGTSPQGSAPSSPTPQVSTTDTNQPCSSMEHSTCQDSSSTATAATPLDTSMHLSSDATGSTAGTNSIASHSGTTTHTGVESSSSLSSPSSTHHSSTTSTIPFTGSSGAESLLIAMAALSAMLGSVVIQVVLF